MDEYARAAARVHAALGALQAAPESSRGRYTDEFTQELYDARSVRKMHSLPRMPFIAQLTELIASCKPVGEYGLVPEMFARALADVRSIPSVPYAGDLGPDQWWRAIPSASAPPPPAPGPTYHAPPSMPVAGPSRQYSHAYPQHHARSLSPPPPPPSPPHGRKRTASAAQLDPRPEHGAGGRDKFKFEMWTGGQHPGSSLGQSVGTGAPSARAQAKYARYNPTESGPPKGYELCTDEQSRCDRCRERGIECWKGRKRKRASGACWNCHKLKRPCSMAKDWFATKPFAAMSEPYETDPGSVVVLQLNEAGRLLSPREAAMAEEQAHARRQQQQTYASSSHVAYPDDRQSDSYTGRDHPHHKGARARSSTYAGSSPPDTAYSSPAPHALPLPPIPGPYSSHQSSRRTSVSTPYAQHPRYYSPPPAEVPSPPPINNMPLAIPPPPPPERIHYSTHVQAPMPLDVPPLDTGPRPIPPPPPPDLPHYHGPHRSATPHGSSSYTCSETSASASAPVTGPTASTSSQARSSSSQSHSSHEYPYASGPPQGYYEREPPPERYREPAERYYGSPPPPRSGHAAAYYERETHAAAYPHPPGHAYPAPEAYPRPGYYPPPLQPHPHPHAHRRYNPLVDARHDPYAYSGRPDARAYPPPPHQLPPLTDSRVYPPQPYGASQSQYFDTRPHYGHDSRSRAESHSRKRAEPSPVIPPPPPLEWPDHPPRTAYERRRASTRDTGSGDRDTVSRDRDSVAPEESDGLERNGDREDGAGGKENREAGGGESSITERARALLASARGKTSGDVEIRSTSPTPVLTPARSPERDSHRVDQRGRMLLASARGELNGDVTAVLAAAPVPVVQRQDEENMDRDIRSPYPSRTPASAPPPLPTVPPGSTGAHSPSSAAAAERPACARPPNSSVLTASAGGTIAEVNSSPPRGGPAKRPWLI